MGVDSRGKERGECQECDCSDYEIPDRGNRCSYCDCAPTKHQMTTDTKSSKKGSQRASPSQKTTRASPNNNTRQSNKAVVDSSQSDKSEPKQVQKKSTKDIRADFEVTGLKQDPLDAEPEKDSTKEELVWVKQQPVGRNSARPPPARRGEQQRNTSPKDGGSGPMPPAGSKARKKKSVAVKCHNLDQVMSSHLSDPSTRKRIDEMFSTFDDDASNELDRGECKDLTGYILQQCGLQPDIIPAFVYDEAFDKYDDDGGGTITLDEFREFLNAFLSK